MTKVFYGFIRMSPDGSPTYDVDGMFNDFILKEASKRDTHGYSYYYKGHWEHPGCYWMVLE